MSLPGYSNLLSEPLTVVQMNIYLYYMKAHTTLTVDEEVWRTFRAECIKRRTSASKLIQEFMRMSLKKWGVEVEEQPKQKRNAASP